jgi:hypothetical protein
MNVPPGDRADRSTFVVMGPTVRSAGADDTQPSGQEDR